jgi:hypothetical protein
MTAQIMPTPVPDLKTRHRMMWARQLPLSGDRRIPATGMRYRWNAVSPRGTLSGWTAHTAALRTPSDHKANEHCVSRGCDAPPIVIGRPWRATCALTVATAATPR